MRQENQGEERVADQGEGREHAEIAEQFALGEHQAAEGADGCQTAQEDRRGFFTQHPFRVCDVVEMDQDVETVTDGDAEDDGSETQCHQRHVALDPVHAGHGEDGAVGYGDDLLPDERPVMEAQQDDNQDDDERDAHRHEKVFLEGAGVGYAAERIAEGQDADLGVGRLERIPGLLQHVVEAGRDAGVHSVEGRVHESERRALVGEEEMTVHDRVAAHVAAFPGQDAVNQNPAQVERVHRNHRRGASVLVLHDEVIVLPHLGFDGFRGHRRVETAVPGGIDEGGEMGEGIIRRAEGHVGVQPVQEAFDEVSGGVPGLKLGRELVHVLSEFPRRDGIIAGGGHLDEDFVLEGDLAERKFVVHRGARQEFEDFLLETQARPEEEENQETADHQAVHQPFVLAEIVIYGQKNPVHYKFLVNSYKCKELFGHSLRKVDLLPWCPESAAGWA